MESSPVPQGQRSSSVFAIPLAIVIAGILVSASILFSGGDGPQQAAIGEQQEHQEIVVQDFEALEDNDPVLGDVNAPITIVEFSDFQCPFCRSFYDSAYEQIKSNYVDKGLVKIVYRDYPLSFHAAARPSALAAECANEQGRFWDYHDKMFDEQGLQGSGTISYTERELKRWASEIGLDAQRFDRCLDSEQYASEVDADFDDGQRNGVSGTPSFFVNGRLLVGAQPYTVFQQAIEEALN